MRADRLRIVILGLTITSSWGNGHATTYRSLVRGLVQRGHSVLFLEHDKPWYAANRDLADPPFGNLALYDDVSSLEAIWGQQIASADMVIVGSYVPDGIEVGNIVNRLARGLTAFYDIDTPVTLARLADGSCDYICPRQIPRYGMYLSFTGGPTLADLEERWGAQRALPLYCTADPDLYHPRATNQPEWDLGYLGTFSTDRQPKLDEYLIKPAEEWREGRFAVAGPSYPDNVKWPANVHRIEHLPPADHVDFYTAQRFTLNVTRADMVQRGWSPSVRLFEAACCGTPIISDWWEGLDSLFKPGEEVLIVSNRHEALELLRSVPDSRRVEIGLAARARVLTYHTADVRVRELESYVRGTPMAEQRVATA